MPYEQPNPISPVGGIDLHGREGIIIEFGYREDGETSDRNISGADLYFEVEGVLRKALDPGDNNTRRNVGITQADVDEIWAAGTINNAGERYLPFVVRWETIDPPQVVWEGLVTLRGYIGAPT
jgi:hypothetical protein